jgi:hypothetical protein
MDRAWITIVTNVGAFAVSILCIFLGYELLMFGAQGGFKLSLNSNGTSIGLESLAPGIAFAFFGAIVASVTVYKSIGRS